MGKQSLKQCVKCQKNVSEQAGVQKKEGFMCNECEASNQKKSSNTKKAFWAIGSIIVLVVAGFGITNLISNKKSSAQGFEGVASIHDNVKVEVEAPTVTFDLATATVQSSPVEASSVANDIASFKRIMSQNVEDAKASDINTITIPSVFILFNFESANLNSDAKALLREYADTYSQTDKSATILIEGYACSTGSNTVNNWVSEERTKAVKNAFVSAGVPEDNVEIHWYGKSNNQNFSYSTTSEYRRVNISIK